MLKDLIRKKLEKSSNESTEKNNSNDDDDTDNDDDSDEEQDTDNIHFISSLKGMFTKREELDEIDQYLIKKKEERTLKKKIKEGKKCL